MKVAFNKPFYLDPSNHFGPNHETVVNFCKWIAALTPEQFERFYARGASEASGGNPYNLAERITTPATAETIYYGAYGHKLPFAIFELIAMHELIEKGYGFPYLKFFDVKHLTVD
jgi:hypothetical protein